MQEALREQCGEEDSAQVSLANARLQHDLAHLRTMPVQWPESRHVRVLPPAEVPSHRDTRPEIRLRPGIISQRTNSPPPRLRDDGKHYHIERRQLTPEEEAWSAVLCRRPRFLAAAMELRGAHASLTRFSAETDVEERFLDRAPEASSSHGRKDGPTSGCPSMWDACLLDAPHHPSSLPRALHQRPEAQTYR